MEYLLLKHQPLNDSNNFFLTYLHWQCVNYTIFINNRVMIISNEWLTFRIQLIIFSQHSFDISSVRTEAFIWSILSFQKINLFTNEKDNSYRFVIVKRFCISKCQCPASCKPECQYWISAGMGTCRLRSCGILLSSRHSRFLLRPKTSICISATWPLGIHHDFTIQV